MSTETETRAGEAAAVELVRAAMAAGVACAVDRMRAGEVDPAAPLGDAFGDFPAEFLRIRPQLPDAFAAAVRVEHGAKIAAAIEYYTNKLAFELGSLPFDASGPRGRLDGLREAARLARELSGGTP